MILAPAALILLGQGAPTATPPESTSIAPRVHEVGKARILRDISYAASPDPAGRSRQSLDLYLPGADKPPLVIFVHGGFWTLSDDNYRIGPSLAETLQPTGIAVGLVRYRLAPTFRHPTQARDVAAAVAYLIRQAKQYGYDPKRVFLAGHSAGAHLAALVALDPGYLAPHGLGPNALAGVIAFSGIYDLRDSTTLVRNARRAIRQAFGEDPAILASASPIKKAREDAPPFLILSAEGDIPGFQIGARRFADALRAAGHAKVTQHIIRDLDHFSIVRLDDHNRPRALVLAFLKDALPLAKARSEWLGLPVSTAPFWRQRALIRSYPIDERFVSRLLPIYGSLRYELLEWPLKNFYAIDLLAYLKALLPEQVGRGDYLITTNLRGEKQFWDRRQIEPYKPVIVVGIDEEKNLFRFATFYRLLKQYSWKPGPTPPMMARPLGAFIHFLEEPPLELQPEQWHCALTDDSFRLVEDDPLRVLNDLPREVQDALTFRNGCVHCHSFRGVGARSHHIVASTGGADGGFALALESYPPDVWKTFMFNQNQVAAELGVTPNHVDEDARQALYEIVARSQSHSREPKE